MCPLLASCEVASSRLPIGAEKFALARALKRAVEDVRNTLNNVRTCLQVGGKVFLMKGPQVDPEIKLAQTEMGEYYELEKDIAYTLPKTSHQRRLLIYRKIKLVPLPDFEEEPWPGENNSEEIL